MPPERRPPVLGEPTVPANVGAADTGDGGAAMIPAASSLSGDVAKNAPRAQRLPTIEPTPDSSTKWPRAAAIGASVLLHLVAIALIFVKLPSEAPAQPAPIPIELATLPPPPPPPKPKPQAVPKPPPPQPDREWGGELENRKPGALPNAPAVAAPQATQTPAPSPPPPVQEPPSQKPAPKLPAEPADEGVPVAPAASPRQTQQAEIPTPIPPEKPPAPSMRQAAIPSPSSTQPSTQPTAPDMRQGEGGGDKYLNALRADIKAHRVYPPTAELFRLVGVATYEIVITRQGQLASVQLVRSSGYRLLDQAGFTTIRLSAPFEPVPPDIKGDSIGLTLVLSIGPDG